MLSVRSKIIQLLIASTQKNREIKAESLKSNNFSDIETDIKVLELELFNLSDLAYTSKPFNRMKPGSEISRYSKRYAKKPVVKSNSFKYTKASSYNAAESIIALSQIKQDNSQRC